MNIGKRKVAAGIGLVGVVAAAVVAHLVAGTDGLVVVTLAVVVGSTAAVGWLVANSERRLRHATNDVRRQLDRQREQLDGILSREQAEQLLRALQSGFVRFEGEWQQSREELLATLRNTLEKETSTLGREIAVMGQEVGVAGREVAAVGRETAASNQRVVALTDRIDRTADDLRSIADATLAARADIESEMLSDPAGRTRQQVNALFRRLIDEAVSEMDALTQLRERYPVPDAPPVLGGWAIGSGAILHVLETIEENDVDLVVECGPGASTVYVAELLRRRGSGRVIGLEHDPEFHSIVRRDIERRGLADVADIRLAPLVDVEVAGRTQPWYDPAAWSDIDGIGLLLVDGPPGDTCEMARLPALPLLGPCLRSDAVVVVDDAHRADEQAAIAAWRRTLGWVPTATPPGGFVALRRPSVDGDSDGESAPTGIADSPDAGHDAGSMIR